MNKHPLWQRLIKCLNINVESVDGPIRFAWPHSFVSVCLGFCLIMMHKLGIVASSDVSHISRFKVNTIYRLYLYCNMLMLLSDISSILTGSENDNGTEPESCFGLSFQLKVKQLCYSAKSVHVLSTKLLILIMTVFPWYLIHIPFKLTCIFYNYAQKDFTINWKTVLVFTFYKLSALLASTWLIRFLFQLGIT